MKSLVVAIVAAVLGTSVGLGLTYAEFQDPLHQFLPSNLVITNDDGTTVASPEFNKEPPVCVFLDEPIYDFGSMERNAGSKHIYKVRNDGASDLKIVVSGVSCGMCIKPLFSELLVKQGEVADLPVDFFTKKDVSQFDEGLEIRTSDPKMQFVSLRIQGFVSRNVAMQPRRLTFPSVSAHKSATQVVKVFTYHSESISIRNIEFANTENADFFDVTWKPMTEDQIAEDDRAIGGVAIHVTIKSGLPLGAITQTIKLETDQAKDAKLELPVEGTVVSDISILGPSYDSKRHILVWDSVDSAEGREVVLRALVKGPDRESVEFQLGHVTPSDAFSVTLGDARKLNDSVVIHPITVKLNKNLSSMTYLGPDESDLGQIILKTTHPHVKEVRVFVRFAVK